ncbi:MAG: MurR/RpiR family transcriptional regulator [Proteobacteria bacterium]|nr:MurR/RpiR family transcriptional regulator [Pseudomonadota bacterium]
MAIRDRLTDGSVPLTRSDLKVARALLSNYPAAGLNTVAHLAQAAGVSNPTVVRFVGRLGFDGYPDFQQALLGEVQERMSSPLSMMNAGKGATPPDNLYLDSMRSAAHAVETAMTMLPSAGFDRAVDLATDPALRVHCLGGRFSGYMAGMLWSHLKQLRPGCHWVSGARSDQVDALVDLGRRDLVIVYDYRRYQIDTIRFAQAAAGQGAKIVLFTDPWASPIAGVAEVILTAPVESLSPFDTMVPALAQTEALIAALTTRLSGKSRGRIEKMEALRRAASVTEDAYGAAEQGDEE